MDWFEAARTGDAETLNICLFWGQPVDLRAGDGRTALHLAAERGHTTAVKLLLDRNADPNAAAPGAVRPLTAAVEAERWEMAAALVRRGADPNADGVASIVLAEPPKRKLLALMLEHGLDPHRAHAEWGPYVHFALNDPACWDMFLAAGFDLPRCERETAESLLERALSNGVSRFLHLLSLGANINLPVDRHTGRTMLMTLAADDAGAPAHALVRLLVKRGANVDQQDAAGRSALDYARDRGDRPTLTLLTRLRSEVRRAGERERKRAAKAEAKARAAEAARETRARNAAAKKAAAAQKRAAKECAQLEKARAKLATPPAPAKPPMKPRRPASTDKRRTSDGETKPIEKPARSEANRSSEKLSQRR